MFMKAILYTQYGLPDVLQLKEVAIPALADNAVLVKLCAASVNPLDSGVVRGTGRLTGTGLLKRRQKALGSDFAGRVEAVGRLVKQYQVGDEVFGGNIWGGGGFAKQVRAVEERLTLKRANISFEQAAAVPWRQSLPFKVFGIKDRFSQAKGCQSAWVPPRPWRAAIAYLIRIHTRNCNVCQRDL